MFQHQPFPIWGSQGYQQQNTMLPGQTQQPTYSINVQTVSPYAAYAQATPPNSYLQVPFGYLPTPPNSYLQASFYGYPQMPSNGYPPVAPFNAWTQAPGHCVAPFNTYAQVPQFTGYGPQVPQFSVGQVDKGLSANGPYTELATEDPKGVAARKDFTAAQKEKMLKLNRKRNKGKVCSDAPDDSYNELIQPQKSKKGVSPPQNEWQFDHIIPKDQRGNNSYANCQIVSRKYNRNKWNK